MNREPRRRPRSRSRLRRVVAVVVALAVIAGVGYTVVVAIEGSNTLLDPWWRTSDCRTPAAFGMEYEAINYDIARDAELDAAEMAAESCSAPSATAGSEIVTPDGIRVAGWYIPADAADIGPDGATVVLSHGHGQNKSRMLKYAAVLHDRYNLVLFDYRSSGQSTGSHSTLAVREQQELGAILDWLERTKGPDGIGVLGESMGAAVAVARATHDERIDAIVADSMHARVSITMAERLEAGGHPVYPGSWAIFLAARLRTGVDYGGADPIDHVPRLGDRPLLLLHGRRDVDDFPETSVELVYAAAMEAGVDVELRYCDEAHHAHVVDRCPDEYREWVIGFFDAAFGIAPGDAGDER